jgi:hypothetical protein
VGESTIAIEPATEPVAHPPTARRRLRWIAAVFLTVLVGLLSIVSVAAGYVRGDLLNTDRYVQIVAPLARDPAVQQEVVDAITRSVVDNVRLDDLTENAIALLRARDGRLAQLLTSDRRFADALNAALSALGPLVQNQLEEATRRAATRVVESPQFAEVWEKANRVAHERMLAALRDQGSVLRTEDGTVSIDLGVLVEDVKKRLVDSGVSIAARIPAVNADVVLLRSAELAKAQQGLLLLDSVGPWVPWITLAFAVGAVLLAPDHRRAVVAVAGAVVVSMIILAVVLLLTRGWLLERVGSTAIEPAAAGAVVDAAWDPLWIRLWITLIIAALVAVVALLLPRIGALYARLRGAPQSE